MKQKLNNEDLTLLNCGLSNLHISLSFAKDAEHQQSIACSFIRNPDNSLRWIWPSASRSAAFLKFYHRGSLKSRFAAFILKTIVLLGLGKYVASGACKLFVNEHGAEFLDGVTDWAMFTGTIGENRKIVAWYQKGTQSRFAKIPLSAISANNIINEFNALQLTTSAGVMKPVGKLINDTVLLQSDVFNNKSLSTPQTINDLPAQSLVAWMANGLYKIRLQDTKWWAALKEVSSTSRLSDKRYSPIFLQRIEDLAASVNTSAPAIAASCHGDFTPWNVRFESDKLHVIDWELRAADCPVLYDIFHFIYQDNILIKRNGYGVIKNEIATFFGRPEMKQFLKMHEIDVVQAEKLYLLKTVSYYLAVYSRQDKWHVQVDWLLQVWCEAAGQLLLQTSCDRTARPTVLGDIAHELRTTEYAILKLMNGDITQLPENSDIDICIRNEDAEKLLRYIGSHSMVSKIRVSHRSFMKSATIILRDGSLIQMDLIWKIKRKNIVFLDINEVLKNALVNQFGVKVPAQMHDIAYILLFHLLNHANVPAKYIAAYSGCATAMQSVCDQLLPGVSIGNMWKFNTRVRTNVLSLLLKKPGNKPAEYIRNTVAYVFDCIKSIFPQRGFAITFSGVDGAGKSTMINIIHAKIEKELRKPVVVLRHRPSLLPILSAWKYGRKKAEMKAATTLPRQGKNKAGISSVLRFAYYYFDYLFGQFYIQFRYINRGYIVLYDRYYFDFINDSKRSNIVISSAISAWLYKFLIKPDINYFLYAPSEIILSRKQELDIASINLLTRKYLNSFNQLQQEDDKNIYQAIFNIEIEQTMTTIFSTIKEKYSCAA